MPAFLADLGMADFIPLPTCFSSALTLGNGGMAKARAETFWLSEQQTKWFAQS